MTRDAILASGNADRLGHERHVRDAARIDFEQIDDVVLNRELRVHQADDVEPVSPA